MSQPGSQELPPSSVYVPLSLTTRLSPWIIGGLLDIFLAGFALSLVFKYFHDAGKLGFFTLLAHSRTNSNGFANRNQSQRAKPNIAVPNSNTHGARKSYSWAAASCQILVAIVTTLTAYKTICSLYVVLLICILRRNDDDFLGTIEFTHWACLSGPITTSLIGFVVQTFYINRLYKLLRAQDGSFLSKQWFRWLLMAIIISLALISVAFAAFTIRLITTLQYYKLITYFSACLGTMFACDALITMFTIICMLRTGQRVVTSRRSLLSKFVRFTVFSAAIPAVLALLNLSFVIADNQHIVRWHGTINLVLAKAYFFTLLWTLEYRRRLATESSDSHNGRPHHEALSIPNSRNSVSERSQPPHAYTFARTVSYYDIELQKPAPLH